MTDKRIDGFFYGLFMDKDIIAESNVVAENPRHAFANDYALFIGSRATLAPSAGQPNPMRFLGALGTYLAGFGLSAAVILQALNA